MKICYICADPGVPIFGRKGCSTHVRETCLALLALGHDLRLICSNADGDAAESSKLALTKVEPYRSRKLGFDLRHILLDRRIERQVERTIEEWKPDAIYERYSLYSRSGTRLAKRRGLAHLLEVNALMTEEQSDRLKIMPLARRYERKIFSQASHVIVVSEPLREKVIALGANEHKISRMPMAVNVSHFNPSVDGSELRKSLGLQDRFVIGYAGTLTGWHGIDLLYDLAGHLKARGLKDFTILVVGGDERRLLMHRQKVKDQGLVGVLEFVGAVPYAEVPKYLRAMDVALVPDTSYWSSPAKLFEYEACGIPVLAPRYPAVEIAMTHAAEGYIFPPRDTKEMARLVHELHNDRHLRLAMGRQGRATAEKYHSWEIHGHKIIEILQSQISHSPLNSDS